MYTVWVLYDGTDSNFCAALRIQCYIMVTWFWTAVGVTDHIIMSQLMAFATHRHNVATVRSFGDLTTALQMVMNQMLAHCGRVTITVTTGPTGKRLTLPGLDLPGSWLVSSSQTVP